MHHHCRKWINRRSEHWLFVQASLLLPLAALFLRIFGFKRCYVGIGRLLPLSDRFLFSTERNLAEARRIAKTVAIANHSFSPFIFSCLPESFTLWCLLRRRKIAAELRVGVRTITGLFESHAWVEYQNSVLNDIQTIADIYAPFDLGAVVLRQK